MRIDGCEVGYEILIIINLLCLIVHNNKAVLITVLWSSNDFQICLPKYPDTFLWSIHGNSIISKLHRWELNVVVGADLDIFPDSSGHKARTPVPPVVVSGLS